MTMGFSSWEEDHNASYADLEAEKKLTARLHSLLKDVKVALDQHYGPDCAAGCPFNEKGTSCSYVAIKADLDELFK